jgi:deoxyribodipyrimidine photolyase-related protein
MAEKEVTLIYPHQLFKSHPALNAGREVFLIEDEHFFSAFRFHKQKLVLHRASLQAYARLLERKHRVTYVRHD